jgi:riboflavin synthase
VASRNKGDFRFNAGIVTEDAKIGDSIAVNGCCLTVTDVGDGWWEATAVEETLSRTNLADLAPGDPVNFERPVRVNDRLGGHIVQGHVDCVGTIVAPAPNLRVSMPKDLTRYVVPKGSITVDGCSLTVVEALEDGFTVALIPHTADVTTLGVKQAGDHVNLEVDMVAKYVERLLEGHR